MKVYINSEIGDLQEVLLGPIKTFSRDFSPINSVQRYYFKINPPRYESMIIQHEALVKVFEERGIKIHWAEPRLDSPLQFYIRDVALVVNDQFIVCAMKEPTRQNEPKALNEFLLEFDTSPLRVNAGFIEGGDIFVDKNIIYVGLGERTNPSGLKWLENNFGNIFEIFPIRLRPNFLHLDVVFNILGENRLLLYSPSISDSSLTKLKKRFTIIEVTSEEQFSLATNVLSLLPKEVISEKHQTRINTILMESGYEVIELDYSEIKKIGGSFRCNVSPLVRQSI